MVPKEDMLKLLSAVLFAVVRVLTLLLELLAPFFLLVFPLALFLAFRFFLSFLLIAFRKRITSVVLVKRRESESSLSGREVDVGAVSGFSTNVSSTVQLTGLIMRFSCMQSRGHLHTQEEGFN